MDKYNVTGMTCSACSARVEKAVSNVEGVTSCQVNLLTNSMMVDGTADSGTIVAAVEKEDTVRVWRVEDPLVEILHIQVGRAAVPVRVRRTKNLEK